VEALVEGEGRKLSIQFTTLITTIKKEEK